MEKVNYAEEMKKLTERLKKTKVNNTKSSSAWVN